MTYEVGTKIDLSYLNQKREVPAAAPRKSALQEAVTASQEASQTLFEVGTQFVFNKASQKLTRRIQVQFA